VPLATDDQIRDYYNPQGQVFATIGTAGQSLHSYGVKPFYVEDQYRGYGFLNIAINGLTLTAKFYSNNGAIQDIFTITNAN
jgi:hypothetical protein